MLVTFWPPMAIIGPNFANIGKCWRISVDIGPRLDKFGRPGQIVDRCRPTLAEVRPNLGSWSNRSGIAEGVTFSPRCMASNSSATLGNVNHVCHHRLLQGRRHHDPNAARAQLPRRKGAASAQCARARLSWAPRLGVARNVRRNVADRNVAHRQTCVEIRRLSNGLMSSHRRLDVDFVSNECRTNVPPALSWRALKGKRKPS